MTSPIDPIAVAVLIAERLDALGIVHTIGGSIASAFAGEPRSTADIDLVAAIGDDHVAAVVAALSADFYLDEEALRRAVRDRGTVNLIHQDTQIKVDVFIAGGTPIDGQQLARRQKVQLTGGRWLYVHPPEDILLQKLRWYVSGQVSDQWRDILAIVRVQGQRLDRGYVEANGDVLGVRELLARAFDESEERR